MTAFLRAHLMPPTDAIFDLVIVGGGLVGGYLADRLKLQSPAASIAIFEAGPWTADLSGLPEGLGALGRRPPVSYLGLSSFSDWPPPVERSFGGRSWCWHGLALRVDQREAVDDVEALKWLDQLNGAQGGIDWIKLVEDDLAFLGCFSEEAAAPKWLPSHLPFVKAPLARTSPKSGDPLVYSPYLFFHDNAQASPILCYPSCPVTDISLCTNSWSLVISAEGKTYQIYARHVGICAGAVGSVNLYHSATKRDRGKYSIFDHIVAGCVVTLPIVIDDVDGNAVYVARIFSPFPYNIYVSASSPAGSQKTIVDVWCAAEQDIRSPSHIYVDKERAFISGKLSPQDYSKIDRLHDACETVLKKIAHGCGVNNVPINSVVVPTTKAMQPNGEQGTPLGTIQRYFSALGTVDHEGASLGFDRRLNSVGQIDGLPNLWFAGASSFPRMFVSNPSLLSLATAARAASAIAHLLPTP